MTTAPPGGGVGAPLPDVRLSVLVPVYDEEATLRTALERLLAVDLPCPLEVVAVDDGSRDTSGAVLEEVAAQTGGRVRALHHERNRGKGAALRTAAAAATGSHVVVYDADLEYDPADLPALLEPVVSGRASVVYGTRTFTSHNAYSAAFVLGNRAVTLAANLLFNVWIHDLETCWKLLPRETYRSLDLRASGFGTEAELTGKLLRRGTRIYEVPVSYAARSREEGKKLTWVDGVDALRILVRERVRPRPAR